jgi:hypothetical protein
MEMTAGIPEISFWMTRTSLLCATVAMKQGEADAIVARLKKDFRLQGHELKGRNLIKRPSNRKVVDAVLQSVQGRFSLTVHHRRSHCAASSSSTFLSRRSPTRIRSSTARSSVCISVRFYTDISKRSIAMQKSYCEHFPSSPEKARWRLS